MDKTNQNPNIDFKNIMKNKEAYFEPHHIQSILDYWYEKGCMQSYLLFLLLYRTGRRISEVIGKPPFSFDKRTTMSNYKGIRPCDFHDKLQSINFEILKKMPVRAKTKKGKEKTKENLKLLRLKKSPIRKLKAIDTQLYELLKQYINTHNIGYEDRIFPISRETANLRLKEACKHKGIKMNLGKKNIRNRNTTFIQEVVVKPHLHMFRHTFSILFLKNNEKNPSAYAHLSQYLEHSNINMTMNYSQFAQKDTIELLDNTFK